uniref:Uncharacterized protein n=1 Tax=Octactis speculum TaxID=3111310 RepID=A0A7S2GL34_9STRA|mmetsp:Transcript_50033/g.68072  ORF Transcript_50033/g.68072 Transcript_50033/m.68072 type:complete len:126 (+) Transcript_50033:97-474(+)
MSRALWTFKDLAQEYKTAESLGKSDPSNPVRHFHVGMCLQMAGQSEKADQHYDTFCEACRMEHSTLDAAIKFYEERLDELKGEGLTVTDDREAYNANEMIEILRKYYREEWERDQRKLSAACTIM